MKQRILLVHNYYKISGGEDTVVANEKRMLEQRGHKVFLYSRSNNEMEQFGLWKKLLLPFASIFSLRTFCDVKRLIRQEKIDIVHVHNTLSLVSPSVYYAAYSCGVPVVQTLHNFRMLCPAATFLRDGMVCEECLDKGLHCAVKYGCYRGSRLQSLMSSLILMLHRWSGIYKKVNYICLTEFNRRKLLELNRCKRPIVCEKKTFVKSNFVKIQEVQAVEKKHYIFVGRLENLKGIKILLEAWKSFPDKPLILCGTGPEELWVKEFLEQNRMDQVEVRGHVCHEEVLSLIAGSKALILPTRCYEGQPMTILESYSVGTPVIASDLGNPGAMVIPGKTGERFACGDAAGLCQAVRKLEMTQTYDTKPVFAELYAEEKNYEILRDIYREAQEQSR